MISPTDILKLPYTADLTESGIAVATRSLTLSPAPRAGYEPSATTSAPTTNKGSDGSLFQRMRRIVGAVAVELAFRRALRDQGVQFDVINALPFSDPERYDVSLGGHRCILKNELVSRRNQISALRTNPAELLLAPAVILEDDLSSADRYGKELLIFTFLLGLTTNSHEDIRKALAANQPIYMLHAMPAAWAQPETWVPNGRLQLKSECRSTLQIELGGLDAGRNFISERVLLNPLERVYAANSYYSLAYLHSDTIPDARVALHYTGKSDLCTILPYEWDNIWVYGLEIWLTGFLQQDEFRRKASSTFSGSQVFQYSKTRMKQLSVPVSELYSLEKLFKLVKNWETSKKIW